LTRNALLGVAHGSAWGDKVIVVLHHVPESEEAEEGYEAVTTTGIPHGVAITANDSDSAEGALNRLLEGLRAFGFVGRVDVGDAMFDVFHKGDRAVLPAAAKSRRKIFDHYHRLRRTFRFLVRREEWFLSQRRDLRKGHRGSR
jgi:hypothetical protein